jgi:nucleoside transporter
MKATTRVQLSAMMFLQFFVWGAWYVTMGTYLTETLKATGVQTGAAYSANAIATIISPFIVGLIADRYFAAQKFMGVLHLVGAALLYYSTTITDPNLFFWIILVYSAAYMPTLALSNAVAFNLMSEPDKEFPRIRVFGTLGWIAVGLLIGALHFEGIANLAATDMPFKIAAAASLLLGLYSFTLPNTPPKAQNTVEGRNPDSVGKGASIGQILGLDALVLFKDRSYLVFFISSILVCIPLSFYYSFTNAFLTQVGMENATGKMTMGQMSEVLFLVLLPLFYKRLGIRNILIVAMLAWMLRFLCFGFGNVDGLIGLFYLGIILHGVCFDFFFVSGMIYTETKAGATIKSAAQGLITFATYGVGMFIGTYLSGLVKDAYTLNEVTNWQSFWLVPAGITVAVLAFLFLFFKEKDAQKA